MIKIILLLALAFICIVAQISAFIVVALIISAIVFINAWGKHQEAMKKEPSKMVCKNCGSTNVRIYNREEGWTTGGFGGARFGMAGGRVSKNINRQHIAVCADCGFDSPYTTLEDIEEERKSTKSTMNGSLFLVILFSVIFALGLAKINAEAEEDDLFSSTSQVTVQAESTSKPAKTAVSGVEVTKETEPISDFLYKIEGDTVQLHSANTRKPVLIVSTSYVIDGKKYKTDLSDFQLRSGGSQIKTVIFEEGITEVKTAIFNSSDVENIFFPKSMKIVYDNTLAYLHPDEGEHISIYYAGTQDEWAKIFTEYKRTSVSDAKTYEAKGESIADKLNELTGMKYDSSIFDFYFSSTPTDLLNK